MPMYDVGEKLHKTHDGIYLISPCGTISPRTFLSFVKSGLSMGLQLSCHCSGNFLFLSLELDSLFPIILYIDFSFW